MKLLKLCEDLRFFIGAFFMIIGTLLLLQGWLAPILIADLNPNLISGAVFLVFGTCAMAMACGTYLRSSKS